jgi:hypothetical protein
MKYRCVLRSILPPTRGYLFVLAAMPCPCERRRHAQAANLYQSHGLVHGNHEIRAADAARTRIIKNVSDTH